MNFYPLPCAQVQAQAHAAQPRALGPPREVPVSLEEMGEKLLPELQPPGMTKSCPSRWVSVCLQLQGSPRSSVSIKVIEVKYTLHKTDHLSRFYVDNFPV